MTAVSGYLYCACVVFAFAEVVAWTVDLEEVRKFFDDHKRKEELEEHWSEKEDHYGDYGGLFEGHVGHYAAGYEYGSYMEKKVHGIVKNGTRYLEGLRLSIDNFKLMVENCSRANATRFPGLRWNGTAPGPFNSSWVQGLDSNSEWPQILNLTAAMLSLNTSNPPLPVVGNPGGVDRGRCANATKEREKMRRLADLALYTTKQLQDRAMRGSYEGHEDEEIEQLVRLAWFLEKLAHVTGFDPDASEFVSERGSTQRESQTTEAPVNPLALSIPDDVKMQMINCLQQNSSIPATERCAIPVQLPPLLRLMLKIPEDNASEPISSSTATSSDLNSESSTNPTTPTPLEMLETVESKQMSNLTPFSRHFSAVKHVRKRSLDDSTMKVVKYYVKHKLWDGSNAIKEDLAGKDFSVDNDLSLAKSVQKKSKGSENTSYEKPKFVDAMNEGYRGSTRNKRIDKSMVGEKLPKSKRYSSKTKLVDVKNDGYTRNEDIDKKSMVGEKLPKSKRYSSKTKLVDVKNDGYTRNEGIDKKSMVGEKLSKSMKRRSIRYEDSLTVRQSEDPMQDISYYVKNKPGTNIRPSLVGVAEARLALERIFQTGNIEVVRRYGANYNPLIPSPFYFGMIKTLSDI